MLNFNENAYTTLPASDGESPPLAVKRPHLKLVYLDGLRGLACLSVTIWHFYSEFYAFAYAEVPNSNLSNSPWVSFFFNGGHMVSLFFVLSGRVLAEGFYRKAHDPKHDGLKSLKSAVIRRPIRLFIPILGLYIMLRLFAGFGWVTAGHERYFVHLGGAYRWQQVSTGKFSAYPFTGITWIFTVKSAIRQVFTFEGNLFGPLWTIPAEFHGSLMVYLVATVTTKHAIFGGASLAALTWYLCDNNFGDVSYIAYFLGGLLLCHCSHTGVYDFLFRKAVAPNLQLLVRGMRWLALSTLFFIAFFVWWGYNTTFFAPPMEPYKSWVRAFYGGHEEHFVQVSSSICTIAWVDNVHLAQWVLGSPLFAYLGRISFSMYLIHAFLFVQVGSWIMVKWLQLESTRLTEEIASSAAFTRAVWLINFPLCLLVLLVCSSALTRLLDDPAIKLGHLLLVALDKSVGEMWSELQDAPQQFVSKFLSSSRGMVIVQDTFNNLFGGLRRNVAFPHIELPTFGDEGHSLVARMGDEELDRRMREDTSKLLQ